MNVKFIAIGRSCDLNTGRFLFIRVQYKQKTVEQIRCVPRFGKLLISGFYGLECRFDVCGAIVSVVIFNLINGNIKYEI